MDGPLRVAPPPCADLFGNLLDRLLRLIDGANFLNLEPPRRCAIHAACPIVVVTNDGRSNLRAACCKELPDRIAGEQYAGAVKERLTAG
jgi:hypothetical protein